MYPFAKEFNILFFFWADILTLIYIQGILTQVNPTVPTLLKFIRLPLTQVEYFIWPLECYLIISSPTMCAGLTLARCQEPHKPLYNSPFSVGQREIQRRKKNKMEDNP